MAPQTTRRRWSGLRFYYYYIIVIIIIISRRLRTASVYMFDRCLYTAARKVDCFLFF